MYIFLIDQIIVICENYFVRFFLYFVYIFKYFAYLLIKKIFY